MSRVTGGILVLLVVFLGLPASAATIQSVEGQASINSGTGFKKVKSGTQANVGDRVMVSPGGSAVLMYSDGCEVKVQPDSVTTVSAQSPCASPSSLENPTYRVVGPLLIAAGTAFLVYCVSSLCTDEDGDRRRRPVSP